MNEQAPTKTPQSTEQQGGQGGNFPLAENGLYLPTGVHGSPAYADRPGVQELRAQNEDDVFGVDGNGSIRNESVGDKDAEKKAEDLERSIDDMLDPKNVIDLKEKLENKSEKLQREKQLPVDGRLDKDGAKHADKVNSREDLKQSLINSYTQVGSDPENPRDVPEKVKNDISRMLDMSFDELEAKMEDAKVKPNGGTINTTDPNHFGEVPIVTVGEKQASTKKVKQTGKTESVASETEEQDDIPKGFRRTESGLPVPIERSDDAPA